MITIPSTYATAIVYTDIIEPSAEGRIKALCDLQLQIKRQILHEKEVTI